MCTFDLGVLMTDEAPLQVGPPKIELSITFFAFLLAIQAARVSWSLIFLGLEAQLFIGL